MRSLITPLMKTVMWILLLFYSFAGFTNEEENQIFDSNQINAIDLLYQEYINSKVLFIGFSYHHTHQHIDQLRMLLKRIGTDPDLKYIVLERAGDISEFYETLSLNDLSETLEKFTFPSALAKKNSLCMGEWAYSIDKLFPDIRHINKRRDPGNPVLSVSIDGMDSFINESWPGNFPIAGTTCNASELRVGSYYVASTNREMNSAENFSNRVWMKLGPNDKAIVLYNRMHLINSFISCNPFMVEINQWEARLSSFSWRDYFLKKHPDALKNTSLVVMDERHSDDRATFKFTQRQFERFNEKEWAVSLKPFQNILHDTGLEMFMEDSPARYYISEGATSKTLPVIANGLIFNPNAHLLYRVLDGKDYPSTSKYCKD